jgi:hypothetical protein
LLMRFYKERMLHPDELPGDRSHRCILKINPDNK